MDKTEMRLATIQVPPEIVVASVRAFEGLKNALRRTPRIRLYLLIAPLLSFLLLASLFHSSERPFGLSFSSQELDLSASSTLKPSSQVHPIKQLLAVAREDLVSVESRQSRTLAEAVVEYRRRYSLHPPPNFDKWFEFAQANNVQLLDEYDSIYDGLLPFWSLSPRAIRFRAKHALGGGGHLMGIFIRDGAIVNIDGGSDWKQAGTAGPLQNFVQYLPDMDYVSNQHDECRVVLPHDELVRHLQIATEATIPEASSKSDPQNIWSERPEDLNSGYREYNPVPPFNEYPHQYTWTVSRLSCPVNSPARELSYEDRMIPDQDESFTFSELGFISNRTAFTDICLSPSLRDSWGLFNKPNAWAISHELLPIFSPSKMSNFQDILIPGPWYLADKVSYSEDADSSWEEKQDSMFWRGSPTSGYAESGSWHRQHRQHFVERVEKPGTSAILEYNNSTGWQRKDISQEEFQDWFDVHFSRIGQCAEEDCDEQRQYFAVRPDAEFDENYQHRYLLDIDGNGYSGRYYAFLQSRSLTFKLAMFREWHEERLKPWVHYVPLSVKGTEHVEALRYFQQEEEGKVEAQRIAEDSTMWHNNVLRKVDMQAYLFRLLLEYGRLIDDNRENIGFKLVEDGANE